MKCLNKDCGYTMQDKICSKKENGVFYFMCESCMAIHKAKINKETFELEISLAPDEDLEDIIRLMDGVFESTFNKMELGKLELSFKVTK